MDNKLPCRARPPSAARSCPSAASRKGPGGAPRGCTRVILPERNKKDLPDVPDEIKDELEFFFCSRMEEVLDIALGKENLDQSRAELAERLAKEEAEEAAKAEPQENADGSVQASLV